MLAESGRRRTSEAKDDNSMVNKNLKEVVDKLSNRMDSVEMAVQSSSMVLQESMRLSG